MMLTITLLVSALLLTPQAPAEGSSCTTACHGAERMALETSVHGLVLACIDCHGGDPTAQRDKDASHSIEAGYRGRITRQGVPELCGTCHADPKRMFAYGLPTDQLALYRSSTHGQQLYTGGDEAVAVCTDCHETHGIRATDDPLSPTARARQPETCGRCHGDGELMGGYGLPHDVVDRFRESVHGQALLVEELRGAPTCSDCHGSHGSTPPGRDSIARVCGHCHPSTGEAFARGPHADPERVSCEACHDGDLPGGPADGRAACAACHGAHGIGVPGASLYTGVGVGACAHCHPSEAEPNAMAAFILEGKQRLLTSQDEAMANLADARRSGLYLEDEASRSRDTRRTLVSLGPLAHALDLSAIGEHLADGIERNELTHEALEHKRTILRDRRLLGSALAAVLLMMAGLLGARLSAVRRLS